MQILGSEETAEEKSCGRRTLNVSPASGKLIGLKISCKTCVAVLCHRTITSTYLWNAIQAVSERRGTGRSPDRMCSVIYINLSTNSLRRLLSAPQTLVCDITWPSACSLRGLGDTVTANTHGHWPPVSSSGLAAASCSLYANHDHVHTCAVRVPVSAPSYVAVLCHVGAHKRCNWNGGRWQSHREVLPIGGIVTASSPARIRIWQMCRECEINCFSSITNAFVDPDNLEFWNSSPQIGIFASESKVLWHHGNRREVREIKGWFIGTFDGPW